VLHLDRGRGDRGDDVANAGFEIVGERGEGAPFLRFGLRLGLELVVWSWLKLIALSRNTATAFTIAPTSSFALLTGTAMSRCPSASSRITLVMEMIGREMLRAMR
jgi:hypothetical protein